MKGKHKLKASKVETTKTTETVDYTKMSKKKILELHPELDADLSKKELIKQLTNV